MSDCARGHKIPVSSSRLRHIVLEIAAIMSRVFDVSVLCVML